MRQYAIHPGYVTSTNDWERHYVGFEQLVRLYGVNRKDCVLWNRETKLGRNWDNYEHLFPKDSGQYRLREHE